MLQERHVIEYLSHQPRCLTLMLLRLLCVLLVVLCREMLAAVAGAEVDKLAEKKGMDYEQRGKQAFRVWDQEVEVLD